MNVLLQHKYCELHEAAFALTRWPKVEDLIWIGIPSDILAYVGIIGNSLCIPKDFQLKAMDKQFQDVFYALKKSITKKELLALSVNFPVCQAASTYFIPSQEVILWALLNSIPLPGNLIEEMVQLGIHQIKPVLRPSIPQQKKIKNQIVFQCLLADRRFSSKAELCKDVWLKKYGTYEVSVDDEKNA